MLPNKGTPLLEWIPAAFVELNRRFTELWDILAGRIAQDNAPTLLRSSNEDILVQYGTITVDNSDTWNGLATVKTLTFPTAFDTTPVVLTTLQDSNLDTGWDDIYATGTSTTGTTIGVKAGSDPTSGAAVVIWTAIGKKVA